MFKSVVTDLVAPEIVPVVNDTYALLKSTMFASVALAFGMLMFFEAVVEPTADFTVTLTAIGFTSFRLRCVNYTVCNVKTQTQPQPTSGRKLPKPFKNSRNRQIPSNYIDAENGQASVVPVDAGDDYNAETLSSVSLLLPHGSADSLKVGVEIATVYTANGNGLEYSTGTGVAVTLTAADGSTEATTVNIASTPPKKILNPFLMKI